MEVLVLISMIGGFYIYESQKNNKSKENFKNLKLKDNFGDAEENDPQSKFDEQTRYENSAALGNRVGNIIYHSNENSVFRGNEFNNASSSLTDFASSNDVKDNTLPYLMPDLVHSNMNPLSGSRPRGALYGKDLSESYFDNRIGNVSQTSKFLMGAQKPLFDPTPNVSWANGSPNTGDYQREHTYVSSMQNGVLPFKQQQVGSEGRNTGLIERDNYMPRNVDELRTVSNPKVSTSLEGYEGALKAYVPFGNDVSQNGLNNYESKRLTPIHENSNDEMPGGSGLSRPTMLYDYIELGNIRNNESVSYFGTVGNKQAQGTFAPTQYNSPKRCGDLLPNATYPVQKINATNEQLQSNELSRNVRSSDESTFNYLVGMGAKYAIDSIMEPINNVLRHTRKEDLIENGRIFGVVNKTGYSSYARNTGELGRQTNKESMNNRPNIANGSTHNASYAFNKNQYLQERDNDRDTESIWLAGSYTQTQGISEDYGLGKLNPMHNENTKISTEYTAGMNAKVYAPVVGKSTRKK
jgi:hypothetical protein